jgi:diphthamide synthase subunit DPH2
MGLHSEAGLDRKFIEFTKLMTIYLNHFPAYEKYGLALEIRRAKASKGINFVGYRTWSSKRFIRRRSLYNFRQAVKASKLGSIISILGHARKTHTLNFLLTKLRETYADYLQLPKIYRSSNQSYFALT